MSAGTKVWLGTRVGPADHSVGLSRAARRTKAWLDDV